MKVLVRGNGGPASPKWELAEPARARCYTHRINKPRQSVDHLANIPATLRQPLPLPQPRQEPLFDLSDLSRHVSLLLGLEDPAALQTGALIDGELMFLLYDEDLDDGVHILVDVGGIGPGDDAYPVLRVLMEVNPELSPARGESFGLDGQTGRILFRAFLRDGEFTPHVVAREIARYVSLMHELRDGPLSALRRGANHMPG